MKKYVRQGYFHIPVGLVWVVAPISITVWQATPHLYIKNTFS